MIDVVYEWEFKTVVTVAGSLCLLVLVYYIETPTIQGCNLHRKKSEAVIKVIRQKNCLHTTVDKL